jgi:predicted regulator of Ras-like GTPase activity (Roadblock/LC7/MglB family)
MMSQILSGMRDVDGVHGSFVVTRTGALAGKDLPPMFDDSVLTEVGRRVVRLHEGLCAGGEDFEHCVMRFADHKLYLRCVSNGFLCVLSTNRVNTPALKMALTLTARRVNPLILDAAAGKVVSASVPPPPVADVPPASTAAPSPSGPPSRRQATYRGHRT